MSSKLLINKNFTLNQNEIVVKVVRQSRLTLAFRLFIPAILILLAFFLIYPLFSLGNRGIGLFLLILIIGILFLVRGLAIWYRKKFIISNQRIIDIDQNGLFKKVVSEIPLAKIQDVSYKIKGLVQSLTRLGDVEIVVRDARFKIAIKNINQPQKIQQLITQLGQNTAKASDSLDQLSNPELTELLKKIKVKLGQAEFNGLIEQINRQNIDKD